MRKVIWPVRILSSYQIEDVLTMIAVTVLLVVSAGKAHASGDSNSTSQTLTFEKIFVTDLAASLFAAWGDYNNDNALDLFVGNGHSFEGGIGPDNNFLYRNNGAPNFTFKRITSGAIALTDRGESRNPIWGDCDNDGYLDLFVANQGSQDDNFLYKNNRDGTFTKIDTSVVNNSSTSYGASWVDYDNDGYLDLYVTNLGGPNQLYRNLQNCSFATVPSVINLNVRSLSTTWADYNNDGLQDLFLANQGPNLLFQNNGDGTFVQVQDTVLAHPGEFTAGNFADIDNDGDLDLFVTWNERLGVQRNNQLYINTGPENEYAFEQVTSGRIVEDIAEFAWGTWGDLDNDGDLDAYISNTGDNGRAEENYLYLNNGEGSFERLENDISVTDRETTVGPILGDYDNDGDLDILVITLKGRPSYVYRNETANQANWVNLTLEGRVSNRSAIGARVLAKAKMFGVDTWQTREISGGSIGQNSLRVHFGLGDAGSVDSLIIHWPGSITEVFSGIEAGKFYRIIEDSVIAEIEDNIPTGIDAPAVPREFYLSQNYPNPFNPSTKINYTVSAQSGLSRVKLEIFDIMGKSVHQLVNERQGHGVYSIEWHGRNKRGKRIANGIYYYRLTVDQFVETKKMILLK